jgi:membrane protein implicated in regulation of membrane protease activity
VNTASGVFFTWLLGLIFVVGGVVFLLFLGDNNLLFGLPYLVIGLLLCYGAWRLQKSAAKKAREDAEALDDDAVPPPPAD